MTEDEHLNSLIDEIGKEKYEILQQTLPSELNFLTPVTKTRPDYAEFLCKICGKVVRSKNKKRIKLNACVKCKPMKKRKQRKDRFKKKKQKDIFKEIELLKSIGLSNRKIALELNTSHTNINRYFKNKEKKDG